MCYIVKWLVLSLVNLVKLSWWSTVFPMNVCYWFPPQHFIHLWRKWQVSDEAEGVSAESLCSGQWIVVELMVSTHTQWQSITQSLKHHLRLNVQCLLISSVVRDYKYRLINNIFPAIGNILSAGTKLRLNFWGLREMMETGLELFITCTYQDTEHGPNGSHVSYNWYSSQSKTRQEVDWCGSRK